MAVLDSFPLIWTPGSKLFLIFQSFLSGLETILADKFLLFELLYELSNVLGAGVEQGPVLLEADLFSRDSGVPEGSSFEFISGNSNHHVHKEDADGNKSENHADLTASGLDGFVSVTVGRGGEMNRVGGNSHELGRCLTCESKEEHASSSLVFKHLIN